MDSDHQDETSSFETFRECVSKSILNKSIEKKASNKTRGKRKAKPGRKTVARQASPARPEEEDDPAELAEFIDFLAWETFTSFPEEVRTLSYAATQSNPALAEKYNKDIPESALDALAAPVDASIPESLAIYGIIPESSDFNSFLYPILREFLSAVTAPPPAWRTTRATACEICGRDWIPLTYHHLIPREVHAKVLKRKWHDEWLLNSVAWLCRACHSFVHRMASNEDLAREWYTVERILEREDAQIWAKWASKIRWKAR